MVFESQHYNLSGPTGLGSMCWGLAVDFFHLLRILVSARQLKDMAWDIICSPRGGTKGP